MLTVYGQHERALGAKNGPPGCPAKPTGWARRRAVPTGDPKQVAVGRNRREAWIRFIREQAEAASRAEHRHDALAALRAAPAAGWSLDRHDAAGAAARRHLLQHRQAAGGARAA